MGTFALFRFSLDLSSYPTFGHPLVAADYAFTHNDAGDVLRSGGVW